MDLPRADQSESSASVETPGILGVTLEPDVPEEEPARPGTETPTYMPLLSGSQRSLSLYHLLHPADTSGRPSRPSLSHGNSRPKDIVSKGVISDEIAHTLFFFFHNTLNPIILLLDPVLHTYDYIRTKSTFLFTSILAAAARFIAPVFSSALAKELGDHSVQAILGSKRCTETVQAWMMLYFWKDPRDTRAWTYVGLLCRAAVEIGLDRTPLSIPPTSSEMEHREHRNRIRTWMLAFMMDRALASVTGKDWCIKGTDAIIQDCRRFSNHPLRLHGDAVIAGFAELRLISSKATDSLPKRTKITNQEQQNVIARILLNANFDLDDWHSFWEAETAAKQSPPVFMEFLRFFELHIRLNLNSFAVNLARNADEIPVDVPLNPTMARAETYCYNLAINSLNQLSVLSTIDQRILQYAQDSMSIMIAYAACFLRALVNSPTLSLDDRSKAIQTINETSQLFRRDDDADGTESSAQMQAKFLRSLAEKQAGPMELPVVSPLDPASIDLSDPRMMELMSWFSNPTQIPDPPTAPEVPFVPLGEPSSGLDTLPGLENLGDQGWDELLSSWLDVPPTQDYTF